LGQRPDLQQLSAELPPPLRLAVAYAPHAARELWTALLVLDKRLGAVALGAREPMLAQLRLAWWRDRFRTPADEWPRGEPLLAALRDFEVERAALEGLVDGWEGLIGGEADAATVIALGEARAESIVALAQILGWVGESDSIAAMARSWALADLSKNLGRDSTLVADVGAVWLPRALRPLSILFTLSQRPNQQLGVVSLLRIVRVGLLGR